jgi:outer membrane immunogenic protein
VHAGAAWQSQPTWSAVDPNAPADGTFPAAINLTGNTALGGVGGVQGGYMYQFTPAWVAGIEGDFSWTSLSDHRTSQLFTAAGAPFAAPGNAVSMSNNTEWLASIRGRLGFVGWWNTMFYVTGGGAWTNREYSATVTAPSITTSTAVTTFNKTQSGWVAGGGAEWQATTNILLRAEYLYYNFHSGASGSALFQPAVGALPLPIAFAWNSSNVQVARIAASYKF